MDFLLSVIYGGIVGLVAAIGWSVVTVIFGDISVRGAVPLVTIFIIAPLCVVVGAIGGGILHFF